MANAAPYIRYTVPLEALGYTFPCNPRNPICAYVYPRTATQPKTPICRCRPFFQPTIPTFLEPLKNPCIPVSHPRLPTHPKTSPRILYIHMYIYPFIPLEPLFILISPKSLKGTTATSSTYPCSSWHGPAFE